MVGFSLMHGGLGPVLVLALMSGLVWLGLMVIFAVIRRTLGGHLALSLVVAYGVAWGLVSISYGFWQRLFVEKLVNGPRAADFVQYAAATGDLRTVEAFLDRGVPVDARNRSGATALHAAAVGGQLAVAEVLVVKGADVNALNRYGDSPLENAESEHKGEVARFLSARGGKRIRGTPEQHQKATSDIVREQMEETERLIKQGGR
jgi:hypothetical protein